MSLSLSLPEMRQKQSAQTLVRSEKQGSGLNVILVDDQSTDSTVEKALVG